MSEYRLDITGSIGLSDYSNIHDYLSLVDSQDQLTITLDSLDPEHINLITSMLGDNGFEVSSKGGHEGGKYTLFATRREH